MKTQKSLIASCNLGNGPGWNHGSAATSTKASPNTKPAHAPIAEERYKNEIKNAIFGQNRI